MSGAATWLPMISVGGEAPPLAGGGGSGGGILPGSGSYGDPIKGLGQSNGQMRDTLLTFTATLNATNRINAGLEAGNAARTADQRSQLAAGFDAAQARREAMSTAPTVTGPMLPPDFTETARVPGQPAFDLAGPVPPPAPATASTPMTVASAGTLAPPLPAPPGGLLAGAARLGAAAGRVPAPGPLGLATLLGSLAVAGVAVLSGRTQGTVPASGQLMPGLGYRFDPAAAGGARVTLERNDPGTGIDVPYAELTANAQGALTTRDGTVVGRLKGDAFEIDVNALRAADRSGSPGLTPAPPEPGPEGLTPAAPGGFGPLPGLAAAPPLGVTGPGFTGVDPTITAYNATAKGEPPVSGAIPGRSTMGNTEQWQVPSGDVSQLERDFKSQNVDPNPKEISGPKGEKGFVGKTADGRTITSREWSTDGRPTLQVFGPGNKNVEVRYGSETAKK